MRGAMGNVLIIRLANNARLMVHVKFSGQLNQGEVFMVAYMHCLQTLRHIWTFMSTSPFPSLTYKSHYAHIHRHLHLSAAKTFPFRWEKLESEFRKISSNDCFATNNPNTRTRILRGSSFRLITDRTLPSSERFMHARFLPISTNKNILVHATFNPLSPFSQPPEEDSHPIKSHFHLTALSPCR